MRELPPGAGETTAAYARLHEELSAATLDGLDTLLTDDIHFHDPFSDFRGRERFKANYRRMLEAFDDIRFEITDQALGIDAAYLRWTFSFRLRSSGYAMAIVGLTELRFDQQGRIAAHIDHWDAASQCYERIPLLGSLLRAIRHRFAG